MSGEINRNPRTENKRERGAWEREVARTQGASRGKADRLTEYDANLQLSPVADLTKYILGLGNVINITDLGNGTVRVTISDNFLPDSIFPTTNQINVTDNLDGTITLSTPQDIHTGASPTFANILIPTSGKITFRDSTIFIQSANDGYLDLDADVGIRINQDTTITGDEVVTGVRNQKYYCEAYSNTTRTVVIVVKDEWHPAFGLTQGLCSDFIQDSGGLATIDSIAQNGSDITCTTAAAHGFDVGDPVSLVGTSYDRQYMITAVGAADEFDVHAEFVGDDSGFAIVGDNIAVPVDGIYVFTGFFSGNGLTGASTFEFDAIIDATLVDKGRPSRKFANTTDRGNMAGSFFLDLTAGQKLSFAARNISNTNNFTSEGTNINIHRIV